jgi:hypothetical protein
MTLMRSGGVMSGSRSRDMGSREGIGNGEVGMDGACGAALFPVSVCCGFGCILGGGRFPDSAHKKAKAEGGKRRAEN